jgi:hypothetical protein
MGFVIVVVGVVMMIYSADCGVREREREIDSRHPPVARLVLHRECDPRHQFIFFVSRKLNRFELWFIYN